eukprot:SAG31_NODE_5817_length_2310_cov_41.015830_2_plen_95_part_00
MESVSHSNSSLGWQRTQVNVLCPVVLVHQDPLEVSIRHGLKIDQIDLSTSPNISCHNRLESSLWLSRDEVRLPKGARLNEIVAEQAWDPIDVVL